MKIKTYYKIPILFILFSSSIQNAFADFQDILPKSITNLQESKQIENPTADNTVRNKNEVEKKSKENSSKKNTNTQDSSTINNDLTKHNTNAPVYFEGKSADGSKKTGILNLVGSVVIIQDDTKLTSEKAKLIGNPGNTFGSGSSSIQKAIATGNVHILKKSSIYGPEIKANANEIEFLVPKRIMILKGKAKVWKEQEFINAEYIEINLDTGDINLKEPHGTIDPRSTTNINKSKSASNPLKDKAHK